MAAFDELPASVRSGLQLATAVVYATLGDIDEARRRFAAGSAAADPVDRAMVRATLTAASGAWDRFPLRVDGAGALITADVWSRVLQSGAGRPATVEGQRSGMDGTSRARVLDALCGAPRP